MPRIHDEPDAVAVVRAWWNAAGPAMSRAAFPGSYEDGRLEVVVPDRAWLRELESRRDELMQRLRRERRMDQLREIALVLEPALPPAVERASLPSRPPDSPEPPLEILQAARAIGDEDLSRRWTAAIGRLLGATRSDSPGR
jgi:hypothetical protein